MNPAARRRRISPPRRGSLLLEVVAGLAALGMALVLISRAATAIDRQWRLTAQERVATETLDNAIEAITSAPPDKITAERLNELRVPEHARKALHQASLTAEVRELTEPIAVKRLLLTLSWRPTPKAEPLRRSLAAWVYPSPTAQPTEQETQP
ncbi:hypothetical protein Mal64_07900 [Pseudobythopirellula maris]|uniref:Uncharacterized protein n=1 Tax=Pseudobythopirellula maris TaxID=2527991 RepID=A0A5C5ZU52_9BACT|nr:hypothetical protein [Pseudobythopirellula maris]TWT90401.1 hypothetical protein Mal64_07900 [Pseudobythopirellula maris]